MSEMKRIGWHGVHGMQDDANGEYVLHSDHEAEVTRLRAEISALKDDPSYETACETIRKLRAELQNAAKAALDAVALSCEKEREADRLRAEVEAYQEDAERLMNLVRRYGSSMTNSQIREHLAAMGASA